MWGGLQILLARGGDANEKSQTRAHNSLSCFKNRFSDSRVALGVFRFHTSPPCVCRGLMQNLTFQCDSAMPHNKAMFEIHEHFASLRATRAWQSAILAYPTSLIAPLTLAMTRRQMEFTCFAPLTMQSLESCLWAGQRDSSCYN